MKKPLMGEEVCVDGRESGKYDLCVVLFSLAMSLLKVDENFLPKFS